MILNHKMEEQLEAYLLAGFNKNNEYVYVLKLTENKYYVGKTNNYIKRILFHTSAWVKKYNPTEIIELIHCTPTLEKDKTLEYMRLYGWENVRGYTWTNIIMKNAPKEL